MLTFPNNLALATLYELCASDSLDAYTYDANLVGLGYTFAVFGMSERTTAADADFMCLYNTLLTLYVKECVHWLD